MRGYSGSALRNTLVFLTLLLVAALPLLAQAEKAPSPYTWVETMAGTSQLHGVQWDGRQFVAVGDKGAIFTSADGLRWAPKASGTAASVNGVASDGKTLMAVGQQGLLLQSPDAGSWSAVTGTTSDLSAVAYGQISKKLGLYVAVGPQGTVITSRDGSTWTAVSGLTSTADLNGVFYGGPKGAQRFVAVGNAGAVLTSANGTTWNEVTAGASALYAVAFGGPHADERFVAVGQNGVILNSVDGKSWSVASAGTGFDLKAIAWCGSRFVAVGNAGSVTTSADGLQWKQIQSPTTAWLHGVAFSGDEIVLVGDAGIVEIAGTYAISGKVVLNATTTGVGGVTVTAHDTINLDDTVAVTAADGTYSVTGLGNSTYDVTPVLAPNFFNPAGSTGIVILNASVSGVNFSMIAAHTLSGAVVFPGTVTPPYPVITIDGTNASFFVPFSTTTAPADGSYSGTLPAIGTWVITPQPTGTWVFNPSSASVPMTSDTVLNFQALAEADITGTITAPCDNGNDITVTATAPGGFSYSVVVPSPYGAYTLPVAQNKTYTVTVSGTGYDFTPLSQSIPVGTVAVPGINFTATAFWTISGTCYYSTDGGTTWLPLAGATVTAAPLTSTATSDASGNYTLTHIPTGAFITLAASKAGYIMVASPGSGTQICGNMSGPIFDFGFYPAVNVSGRILYNGTTVGVPGVTVTAAGAGGPYTATTAADGSYTLQNVYSPNALTVTPALAGFTFNPATSLVLVVGPTTGIDFTATGAQQIQGNVSYSNAPPGPIDNVTVTANIAPYGTVSALTDGAGNYIMNVPPLNGIVVTPSRTGFTFTPISATLDTTTITPVTQDFTAPHVNLYTISGSLTGTAWIGKDVTITAAPGLTWNSGVIGAVPVPYTITGCANGLYSLTLTYTPDCPGITVTPAGGYSVTINGANVGLRDFAAAAVGIPTVTGVSPNTGADSGGTTVTITGTNFACVSAVAFGATPAASYTVTSPTSITAVSPAGTGVVDVQVTNAAGTSAAVTADHFTYISTYSISGTVYNTDGISPVAGATLTAGTVTTTSGPGGVYTLAGLPNGTYNVTCSFSGLAFTPQSIVVNNANRTGIDFIAVTAYSISGTVTLGAVGLAGVTVSTGTYSATTAADGTYTINGVPTGTYTVTPTLAGYTFAPTSASVTVGPNATGVNFAATVLVTYTISGTVTLSSSGLIGVAVTAGSYSATTNASGVYTITGVVAGTYTVTPAKTGYTFTPVTRSVTVGPNATAIDFTATAAGAFSISGKVTLDSASGPGLVGVTVSAGAGHTATTAADGTYTIPSLTAGSYTVTPSKTGYTFTPPSQGVTITTASVTGINFVAPSLVVVATATPTSGAPPLTVAFGSTVTGGTAPYTYDWNFGDSTAHGTTASPSHTYASGGYYSVTLTVTDSAAHTATDTHLTISVSSAPLAITATANPTTGAAPLTVAFTATATGGVTPYSYAWVFGDGVTGTGAATTHTYTTTNIFTAVVTVTDAASNTASATMTITTKPAVLPPVVSAVVKVNDTSGFRLKVFGANFHTSCQVLINGVPVPTSKWKSNTQVNAKGPGLKNMLPKGVVVQISVRNNDDGGVSNSIPFMR